MNKKQRAERPLQAVQKGKKYNPKNLDGKRFDKRNHPGNELKIWEHEKLYFKPNKKQLLTGVVEDMKKDCSEKETFAPLLIQILSAVGGACHITTLFELFIMYCGHTANEEDFIRAFSKLEDYAIIARGTVAQGPKKTAKALPTKSLEFVYITLFGAICCRSIFPSMLQIMPTSSRTMTVPAVKANIQSASFISKLIQNGMLSNFRYKPIFAKSMKKNGRKKLMSCRPMYFFNMKGARVLYYNCRKTDGWLKGIITELERASLIFSKKPPIIIVATEDMFMNADLFKEIMKRKRIKANILFTDDESLVKAKEKKFLYTLTVQGNKIVKNLP